ncbi:excalibur calcium-binding domain-containing protein [Sphingomonas gei]|uniref:Excalibur calcium-binding domain-containing protein n=1 Tax=Sphingomonas gei TaxID=1395960 RepID=A0A4V3QZW8_9SPHN|nr:excalibur calcium-binding domain-containing protein [Sphingomonas gei]TGX55822.1 excalibur calcium-binding domain-containing protein [Sphingomonas gei]
MRSRKPFRAVPIRLGVRYRRKRRGEDRQSALHLLGIAAIAGAVFGTASVATTPNGRAALYKTVKPIGVLTGIVRAREPQPGDTWRRCDDARAAGTAPIYAGEPGYREGLDGDSDGIACEPYRGR